MQDNEATPATRKKWEELQQLQALVKAVREQFKYFDYLADGFIPQYKELVDKQIEVVRVKLNECVNCIGLLRTYFYIKEI